MNLTLDGEKLPPAHIVICIQFDVTKRVNMRVGYVLDDIFRADYEGIADAFTPALEAAMKEFARNYKEKETTMTKAELVDKLTHAARCGRYDRSVTKADTEAFLGALTDTVKDTLARSETIPLAGGKLVAKQRPARTGRNPRTGEALEIPACVAVRFVAGKELKEALNGGRA